MNASANLHKYETPMHKELFQEISWIGPSMQVETLLLIFSNLYFDNLFLFARSHEDALNHG